MGMAPLNGGGDDDLVPLADINITPFVDVVLVLLIVFMVAAPLMSAAVPVDLPQMSTSAPQPDEPLVLSIDRDGAVWLKEDKLPTAQLPERLAALHAERPDTPVYLHADRSIIYGRLMEVMEAVQQAGFTQVSLATAPKDP